MAVSHSLMVYCCLCAAVRLLDPSFLWWTSWPECSFANWPFPPTTI